MGKMVKPSTGIMYAIYRTLIRTPPTHKALPHYNLPIRELHKKITTCLCKWVFMLAPKMKCTSPPIALASFRKVQKI